MCTMDLGRCSHLCFLLLTAVFGLSAGLEWHTDEFLHVTGCLGSKVTLGWAYVTQPGEIIDRIYWTKQRDSEQTTIASLYQENFLPKGAVSDRVTPSLLLNAGLDLDTVQLSDTGYYGVQVTVMTKDDQGNQTLLTFTASALLTVVEAPSLVGESLVAQEVTPDATCALDRRVRLTCGHFLSRGNPPVDVVWTDPAGQRFPSSRFARDHFDLDLPRHLLPGNYTCRVTCQSPVLRCLPPESPLLGSPSVHVQAEAGRSCGGVDLTEEEEEEGAGGGDGQLHVGDLGRKVTQLQDKLGEIQDNHTREVADLQAKLQTSEAKLEDMARTQASLFSEMERLKDDLRNQTIEAVREELMSKTLTVQDERVETEDTLAQEVAELRAALQMSEARLGDMMAETRTSLSSDIKDVKDDLHLINQTTEDTRERNEAVLADMITEIRTSLTLVVNEVQSGLGQLREFSNQTTQAMETLEQQIGHLSDKQDRQQDKPDKMKDKTDKLPDKTGKLPGKQEIPAYRPGRIPDTFVSGEDETTPQLPPAFGDIRLTGGTSESEGRVEVYVDGLWFSVCGDGWNTNHAAVVCRQLDYTTTSAVVQYNALYGRGTGHTTLNAIDCRGNETNITSCPGFGQLSRSCGHHKDVSITCFPHVLRLKGSRQPGQGRVEVEINGLWSSVCAGNWTTHNSEVVCRQLGFQVDRSQGVHAVNRSLARSSGPWMHVSDVECGGSERHLLDCPHVQNYPGPATCTEGLAAGVSCLSTYNVRLREGRSSSEGRVEMSVDGRWSGVCSRNWTDANTIVTCRQLGYSGPAISNVQTLYYTHSGPVAMSDVRCNGQESHLALCPFPGFDTGYDCADDFHIGVRCGSNYPVRLVNGGSITRGRLEVYYSGAWGTVCDDNFENVDATVVCRQLGFSGYTGTAHASAHFGQGSGRIVMDGTECRGGEAKVTDCRFNGFGSHDCSHSEDVGVSCSKE